MSRSLVVFVLGGLAIACGACDRAATPGARPAGPDVRGDVRDGDLRGPDAFAAIADRDARARAMFVEAGRVIRHPRCQNCHPDGDTPLQGDLARPHDPPVARGPHDAGLPAMECASCHQDANALLARIPGAPGWRLAPRQMAWRGRSLAAICAQWKDPARNGGRTLAAIEAHVARDPLVGWGWAPGADRAAAPGTQARFAALVAAWIDSGAACPREREEEAP